MFLSIARFSVQSVVLTVTASGSFIEIINGSESNIYFFAASYSPLKSDIKERKAVSCILGYLYAGDREGLSCQHWPTQHYIL